MLADRVAAQSELLRECFVHDRDFQPPSIVRDREVTPGEERDAEYVEVIRPHNVEPRADVGVGILPKPFGRDALPPIAVRKERYSGCRYTAHARYCRELLFDAPEQCHRARRVISAP